MFDELEELARIRGIERLKNTTYIRHILMKEYGWIPEREFYENCSMGEVLRLLDLIGKDKIEEKEHYDKLVAKARR